MDIVTDPNILKAIEDQEIKIRNSIDNDDIVTDPKILKEIENQSQKKKKIKILFTKNMSLVKQELNTKIYQAYLKQKF